MREFKEEPFAVGLKHMNPCGAAVGTDIVDAWKKAYEGDTTSIFGGIVAFNREVNLEVAQLLKPIFLEIVMAPSYAPDALELLCTKKNLRVLEVDMDGDVKQQMRCTSVNGGLLVQNQDLSVSIGSFVVLYCVSEASDLPLEDTTRDPLGTKRETMLMASLISPPPLPRRSSTSFFIPCDLSFRNALRSSPETFSVKPLW